MKIALGIVKEILKHEVLYEKHIYTVRYIEDGKEDITVLCFNEEVPIYPGRSFLNWSKLNE